MYRPIDPGQPLYEQTLRKDEASLRPDHTETVAVKSSLAEVYERLDSHESGTAPSRLVAYHRKASGVDHVATATAMLYLGVNLLRQEKWTDAEPVLRDCQTILDKKLSTIG